MFAIVNIKGVQYKIAESNKLFVPKLKEDIGSKVTFDNVLMYSADGSTFEIGAPKLSIKIEATVLSHVKDEKVIVFKKKKRKGYRVRNGHKQQYTEIQIDKIN
ncbi:MAG TPA: 50S ribosomal protein L21 [Ignavibacteria bacterium]